MKKPVLDALYKLDPRLVLVLVFLVLIVAGWSLALRKPYAQYRQIIATRTTLSTALNPVAEHSSELGRLTNELKFLSEQLSGQLNLLASDDTMAAALMQALDHSAAQRGVGLVGVKPKERKRVSIFEEVSFEVNATGSYLQLCAWMLDFEKTLGNNATITEFSMKAIDEGRRVALTLVIALYRPPQLAQ